MKITTTIFIVVAMIAMMWGVISILTDVFAPIVKALGGAA